MFKIGDFSKLCQVSAVALRHYDQLGLLKPAYLDEANGYRYYSADQMERLNRIVALKDLGFSLPQIATLLDENLSLDEFEGMLKLRKAQVEQLLQTEQARLMRIEARLKLLRQEQTMTDYTPKVTLKRVEAQLVVSLRQIASDPLEVGTMVKKLREHLKAQGVEPGTGIVLVHDPDFQEKDLDVEVAIPIPPGQSVTPGDQIKVDELPAVPTMACAPHEGTPASFLEAYRSLSRWLEANDYVISGVSRDTAVTSADNPAEAIGEIQIPVEKIPPQS